MKRKDVIDKMSADFNKSIKRIDWLFDMILKYGLNNLAVNEPFEINGIKYVVLTVQYFADPPDVMLGFYNKEGFYQDNITYLSYVLDDLKNLKS